MRDLAGHVLTMRRSARLWRPARHGAVSVVIASCAIVASVAMGTSWAGARSGSAVTRLSLNRIIPTSPFAGSTTFAGDNEDIVYVASDDAFWIVDDSTDSIYEVDRRTGALRGELAQSSFMAAAQLNFGALAPQSRTEDLEALAYDSNNDVLYAFSGSTNAVPTAYRLIRDASHQFRVESWQPLPSEWTGAAWRRADHQLYVANGAAFSTFDYATGTFGPNFSVPGLAKVTGIDFDASNGDLIAVNQRLYRVAMGNRTIRSGWKGLRLKGLGIQDSRGVALVDKQIFVSDGSDTGTSGDLRNHAIFVIDVTGGAGHLRRAPKLRGITSSRIQETGSNRDAPLNEPSAPGTARRDHSRHRLAQSSRPPGGVPGGTGVVPAHPGPHEPRNNVESDHGQQSSDDKQPHTPPTHEEGPQPSPVHPQSQARPDKEPKDNAGGPADH